MQVRPSVEPHGELVNTAEWFSMKLFRQMVKIYLFLLRYLSTDSVQKVVAVCSLFSVLGVSIAVFAIYWMYGDLTSDILIMIPIIEGNAWILIGVYSYSVKVFYDNAEQKLVVVFMVMILSITMFIFSVIIAAFYSYNGKYYSFVGVLALAFTNLMSIYYVIWIILSCFVGLGFFLEFIFRLVTCKLRKPYNPAIQLPVILYPALPGLHFTEIIGKKLEFNDTNTTAKKCMICLESFSDGQALTQLRCHIDHVFHSDCLEQWFCIKKACPLCRALILNTEV